MLDRFDCYEACVQSPRHVVDFLRAVHAGDPRVLREDFCGSAAVARCWASEPARGGHHVAVGVELDPETARIARERAAAAGLGDRVTIRHGDATALASPTEPFEHVDAVFVGNFSIGYIHDRPGLIRYLRCRCAAIRPGSGGIFVCDTYGGASAFRRGGLQRTRPASGGHMIHYAWIHERADPATGMVENSMSFRVEQEGRIVQEFPRAFVYRWRLWSITELRDAMREAGFLETEVYQEVGGERPRAVADGDLGEDWAVLVVGRA